MGVLETFNIARTDPEVYHTTLKSIEKLIFAFGGSFLLMVFLSFIFDDDREEKWIDMIENSTLVTSMSGFPKIEIVIATVIGVVIHFFANDYHITLAYFSGVALYVLITSLDGVLGSNGVRNGIMGLLYLEVLDASFSFDGVIGAFALSSNIFIIMIGLGIGAMFVRSLTLLMLKEKTLVEYQYLEHGAHYAILALAVIMLLKIFIHVDEFVVGTVGISFIVFALVHSVIVNRRRARLEQPLG